MRIDGNNSGDDLGSEKKQDGNIEGSSDDFKFFI
ncbi:MAG: hypothetical protein UV30_C0036G0002 [Candidatus Collierbacteria bacterium GW2011_GWF1_42_50]|nr:MAG: hypothetical protein UV30_C0036G0002 [Candidatus Collierbacteria bacterium GW2011_GWF1_42_50]